MPNDVDKPATPSADLPAAAVVKDVIHEAAETIKEAARTVEDKTRYVASAAIKTWTNTGSKVRGTVHHVVRDVKKRLD